MPSENLSAIAQTSGANSSALARPAVRAAEGGASGDLSARVISSRVMLEFYRIDRADARPKATAPTSSFRGDGVDGRLKLTIAILPGAEQPRLRAIQIEIYDRGR